MVNKLLLMLLVFGLFSCYSNKENKIKRKSETKSFNKKLFHNDSVYISYTVKEGLIKNKYPNFNYYEGKQIKVNIDTILYSPDTLKLFAIVIIEEKYEVKKNPFSASAIVGYRNSTNDLWIIYPIHMLNVHWNSLSGTKNVIRRLYFNELKGMKDIRKNVYNSNAGEKGFWNDLVFKKSCDVDSLYNFQTEYNYKTKKYDKIIPEIKINYPDSIVEFYRRNKYSVYSPRSRANLSSSRR